MIILSKTRFWTVSTLMFCCGTVMAQEDAFADRINFFVNTTAVVGQSSGEAENLALHGHDPNQEATVQGIELDFRAQFTDQINGVFRMNTFLDTEDNWDAELEELFVSWQGLPANSQLRAGAFYNRLGLQNEKHLHAWDFVDANLSTSQFLGEEGLVTEGLEWRMQQEVQDLILGLSVSYGRAREHEHEEEGHGEEGHEEEGHEEEGHEEEHEHSESVESAYWGRDLFVLSAELTYPLSDFHEHGVGWNLGLGENGFGRDTYLTSFDYQYTWRENGWEGGGKVVKAQLEYFYRQVAWLTEGRSDRTGQSSLMGSLSFEFVPDWIAGLRYGWIEGVQDTPFFDEGELEYGFETEQLQRTSLALTRMVELSDHWAGHVRLQYNFDDRENLGQEHSIWLQVNLSFGSKG